MANIAGTASLAGTVQANFESGGYLSGKPYDILHSGGLNGTTFSNLVTVNPPNFGVSLSYTPTDVLLDLSASLGSGTNLNANQQGIAGALNMSLIRVGRCRLASQIFSISPARISQML
jgi:hypothetical protein